VLDLVDAAEELSLVVGQRRLRVVVLGAGPGVTHLGHIVLPGQAFGKALGIEGNLQLGHRVSPLLVFDYGSPLYTKPGGEDSDARSLQASRDVADAVGRLRRQAHPRSGGLATHFSGMEARSSPRRSP